MVVCLNAEIVERVPANYAPPFSFLAGECNAITATITGARVNAELVWVWRFLAGTHRLNQVRRNF